MRNTVRYVRELIRRIIIVILENTVLNNKKYEEADEDLLRDMSDIATNLLKENGFIKYEVSNYSLEGFESKHNLTYWFDNEYYGKIIP